jgi:PAS domain S-box-containing protein
LYVDTRFLDLVICRMVSLSLEHGNSDGSCYAYVWLGMLAGPHFGNYQAGFRFGKLGYDLVEKRGLHRYQARTYMCFGHLVMPWTKHFRTGRELVRRTFNAANWIGDLTFASYSCNALNTNLLAAGDPLAEVQRQAETGLEFASNVQFGLVIDCITAQLQLIRTLRGLTAKFGAFNDERFDELRFERHLASNPVLALPECWYWIRKLQARFFAGDYPSAIEASLNAERLLWTSPSFIEVAEYHFYSALSRAASVNSATDDLLKQHFEALAAHQRQHEIWAKHCPENFENRAALIGAEIARIEGREIEAEHLYEKAIRSARANGFIHNEAVAYEVAARFYAARGLEKIADTYLRESRYCYLRWGADAKVKQLDQLYPHLRNEDPARGTMSTILAPAEFLDLATVIKVSQAASGELVLEKLIDRVMRAAIEHAGAERGVLILPRGDELQIEAEVTTSGNDVSVHQRNAPVATGVLPESIVRYVMRTREHVILGDATAENPFSADAYIAGHSVRSILCLPLISRARFSGILYLENKLTPDLFTPDRTTVLKVLASQAAVSLENTRLYRDLEDREARIRRLVDANILGIFMWDLEGAVSEANEAFLHMLKYGREDVVSGRVRWTDLTPPEWRERDERALAELKATGRVQPFEKEYFRKDGGRVSVLIGAALFKEGGNEGVAFVLDLSEQKRTEETLRKQEAYLAESQRLSHTGSWASDGTTHEAQYWSEGMFRIFGFDPQQGLPKRDQWLQRMHPEDRDKVRREASDRMFLQKADADIEFRIVLPDGTVRHIRGLAHPVVSPGGELVEVVGTVADITERKDAEEALRRSESHLAQAQRLARIGSWVLEVPARIALHISEEWYRIFGFDSKDGMPTWEQLLQRVHPEDRGRWQVTIDRAIAEKSDFDVEFRILPPCSAIKYIHSVGHPVLDSSGELLQFVGVAMDVTEGKHAEEALRSSEAYLMEAQTLTHTGSCAIDGTNRKILYWSEEMFRLFGIDPSQGLPNWDQWLQRIHPEDRNNFITAGDRTFLEKLFCDIEFRTVNPDGTIRHIHGIGHPVLSPSGELLQVIGTMVDITEHKHAEDARDRLRRLEADLAHISRVSVMGEMAASLAHEIKQPIGAAVTNAEACLRLLDRDWFDLQEVREAALEMVKDARRAANIIDRVRTLCQKGSSKLDIIDVNELIREMVVVMHNEATRRSITIDTDLAEGLPAVMADRVQLQQALMNLMLNGIEAIRDTTGQLTAKSRLAENDQVVISVIDNGVGLPAETLDRVFDVFFTTKPQGTGLGLAITRSIIESHGGRIWANTNPERGATFHFSLPSRLAVAARS